MAASAATNGRVEGGKITMFMQWLIWVLIQLAVVAVFGCCLMYAWATASASGWAARFTFALYSRIASWLLGPADPRDRALPHRRGLFERRRPHNSGESR